MSIHRLKLDALKQAEKYRAERCKSRTIRFIFLPSIFLPVLYLVMRVTTPITAQAIRAEPEHLVILFSAGQVCIPWEKCSKRLADASEEQRLQAELSPGGYGIHWPAIDEDLSIGGLIQRASAVK